MTDKLTKYGIIIIAAVLLVGVLFAGAVSADYVEVSTWSQLNTSVAGWHDTANARIVAVNANITDRNSQNLAGIEVTGKVILTVNQSPAGNEAFIDGAGQGRLFKVSSGNLTLIGNVSTGAVLNLTGGKVIGQDGGAICVYDGGNLTLDSYAMITGSYAGVTRTGGGVYVNTGTFTMNNGSIAGCSASDGGGVYNSDMFIMNGGSITNCSAQNIGGGVKNRETFIMTNGSITGCSANYGGAVYIGSVVPADTMFKVSGSATVTGNTNTTGAANNVYLSGNDQLNLVGAFTGSIGIANVSYVAPALNTQFGVATGSYTGAENIFADTDENLIGTISGTNLIWAEKPKTYVEVNSWAQLNKSVAEWTDTETARIVAVNASITDRTGQNPDGIEVTGKIILTVNQSPAGNEAVINGKEQGRLFNVTGTGDLTIIGNVSSGAVLNLTGGHSNNYDGGAIKVISGNLTLGNGAKITNSWAMAINGYGEGGALKLHRGNIIMNGGEIINCTSYDGGAVYLYEGTFTMNNGSITGCSAEYGGGVGIKMTGATFIMNNGSITGCSAKYYGGVHNSGDFIMNDGSITDCTATHGTAGGVNNNGIFTMNNGSITSCSAALYGGGMTNDGIFIMNNGRITGCSAEYGGGVCNIDEGVFIMTGGTIASCSALIGSGVYHAVLDPSTYKYPEFNVSGTANISSDDVALTFNEGDFGEYLNINVDADSIFTGSIQNIKLYRYDDGDRIVDPAAWLEKVVVKNGAGLEDKFQLSPVHAGYQLTVRGNDLILTMKAKPSTSKETGSTVILTATPTQVPTATATATPGVNKTVVPINKTQTSKSPAPVFGIIAGLGAAAVLLRLRR